MLGRPGGTTRQPHPQHSQPHPPSRPYSHTFAGHQSHPPNYSPSILPQKPHHLHSQTVVQHQPMQQQRQEQQQQQQQNRQHPRQGGAMFGSPVRPHKKGTFSQLPGRPQLVSDHPLKNEQGQELKTNPPQVSIHVAGLLTCHFELHVSILKKYTKYTKI